MLQTSMHHENDVRVFDNPKQSYFLHSSDLHLFWLIDHEDYYWVCLENMIITMGQQAR